MSDKPTNLYSWAVATPLYAWTQDGVTYYTYTSTVQYKDHLYNATGVDTGEKVGTIYQDGSWDLYIPGYSLDVEGYTYTVDAQQNVVLTAYTGSDTVVIAPQLEEDD